MFYYILFYLNIKMTSRSLTNFTELLACGSKLYTKDFFTYGGHYNHKELMLLAADKCCSLCVNTGLAFFREFFQIYCYENFYCNANFLLFSGQILGGGGRILIGREKTASVATSSVQKSMYHIMSHIISTKEDREHRIFPLTCAGHPHLYLLCASFVLQMLT